MLFQTKLVVLRKAVYQNAFLAFENRLNVDLLSS